LVTKRAGAVLLATLAAVNACAPRRIVEAVLLRDHFALTRDVVYGGAVRQRLDVYHPRSARRPAPMVVSAGGHTAALFALDQRHLRRAGVPAAAVRGFVSVAGPVATSWTDADVKALMGPPESWPATHPMIQVDGTEPPLLLLHGKRDRTVSPGNSVRLAMRIRERGGCARVITYRGLDHVGIVVALSVPRLEIAPVMRDVMTFLRRAASATGC
jgi:acetyl esterase/lipase